MARVPARPLLRNDGRRRADRRFDPQGHRPGAGRRSTGELRSLNSKENS
jgi:hypothetical protein